MRTNKENPQDIIKHLQNQIEELERRLKRLERNPHPTLPEYDNAAIPTNLPNFSIFIAKDNTLRFKRNGVIYNAGP